MNKIRNIIFDLGAVLLDIDFNKAIDAFQQLGFPHFEKMFSQLTVDQLFEKLERGEISPETFYEVMISVGGPGITSTQIKDAWNSLLLDFRENSLDYLEELKPHYNLFLLSNTNAIHLDAFNQILQKQIGKSSLDPYFTKAYFSHLVGLRKPNLDIYEFVLADAGIKASETLFIDDTSPNVKAAATMGFYTHQLLPGEKIEEIIPHKFI